MISTTDARSPRLPGRAYLVPAATAARHRSLCISTVVTPRVARVGIFRSLSLRTALRRRAATAGFTIPELVGVIVVIGILSSVATVQVLNANAQAREFAKYSVAQSLNRLSVAAIVGGASVGNGATNNIDTTTNLTAIAKLNTGFSVGGITFKMAPVVNTPGSYPFNGSPTATSVVFTYTTGAAALP